MNAAPVLDLEEPAAEENHAFEFTPGGIVPAGTRVNVRADDMAAARNGIEAAMAANAAPPRPRVLRVAREAPLALGVSAYPAPAGGLANMSAPVAPKSPLDGAISAKELVARARVRLRELDKLVPALERERIDLRRIVGATTPRRRTARLSPSPTE